MGNWEKSFAEAEAWYLEYWQSKTPQERLSALVAIRGDVELLESDLETRRFPDPA